MNEKMDFSFEIDDIDINDIIESPNIILEKWTKKNIKFDFNDYIIGKLSDKDGGPTLENIQIKNLKYNPEIQSGQFKVSFEINRMYCCSEITSCNLDYTDFHFHLNGKILSAHANYFVWEVL